MKTLYILILSSVLAGMVLLKVHARTGLEGIIPAAWYKADAENTVFSDAGITKPAALVNVNPTLTHDTDESENLALQALPNVKSEVGVCAGSSFNLNDANLENIPSEIEWRSTANITASVIANVTAVGPGMYYAYYTVASGKQRLEPSVVQVREMNCCTTGIGEWEEDCEQGSFTATDPNTLEYDNIVSTFHSTIFRDGSGKVGVWGERIGETGDDILVPQELNYTGVTSDNILKFTGGGVSSNESQWVVLTPDGLFFWGSRGYMISSGLTTSRAFEKAEQIGTYNVNGGLPTNTYGLPAGVFPEEVKMLFGTREAVAITTCTGQGWVLAQDRLLYGDGALESITNNRLWHRVMIDENTPLENLVVVRGSGKRTMMALNASGEIYTWGRNTRLGDGTSSANRDFATRMTLPAGVTPKMIGMSQETYYLLATDGRMFALGSGGSGSLGNFSRSSSNTWVQAQRSSTPGDYFTDIVRMSPNEHSGYTSYGTVNVITADARLWAWGDDDGSMIGGASDPTEMPGSIPSTEPYDNTKLNWTDRIIAIETGGHTSMVIKESSKKYGYVGHRIDGSMGDGTTIDEYEELYNFGDTPEIDLCGADVTPDVTDIGACIGDFANLNDANLEDVPSEIEWHIADDVNSPLVANPTAVSPGTYYAYYTVASGRPRTVSSAVTVVEQDCCGMGCNPNAFMNVTDPNSIEYDNIVGLSLSTIVKGSDGTFKVWGEDTAPDGTGNLISPTEITPANGYTYTGTPLKATGGYSGTDLQLALLTSDGLYVWGTANTLIHSDIKNTTVFEKIIVNGKSDGLPPGVVPESVKMLFGTHGTLAITTCSGQAWVLSTIGDKNGDGTGDTRSASNVIWHRVKTDDVGNPDLENVVAMRGAPWGMFALTADGKLYTWGTGTYLGNGSGPAGRHYATQMTLPAGVTPKMIGVAGSVELSYYLLATDGRLFTMGENGDKQLGDGTTTDRTTWVQPQKMTDQFGQGTGTLDNIAWISPREHGFDLNYPINVLTNDKKLWRWADSSEDLVYMPGNSTGNSNGMDPTDNIVAVETGGYFSINMKEGSEYFGFMGRSQGGTIGDGVLSSATLYTNYTYNTAIVDICSIEEAYCTQPGSTDAPTEFTKTGISDRQGAVGTWPGNVPNGFIAIQSSNRGFVITRLTTDQINTLAAVEGMLVYDTDEQCIKLYNGTTWNCIERGCNE